MTALRIEGFYRNFTAFAGKSLRLIASARFETALLGLLLLTAVAVACKTALLDRTIRFTPESTAGYSHLVFSDGDTDGKSSVNGLGSLRWTCDLRAGNAYPYCGYELFLDHDRGTHGLNLTNMRSLAITMVYRGASSSFRIHLKNFDPRYSVKADDESPKYLRVEADTTPGQLQHTEFVLSDFGVADWWLRKRKLPPQFGRPQFDDVTSLIVETGSEAPLGHHEFDIREVIVHTAVLNDAQWYSLLLGIWIVMVVLYLGYRVSNLRRALEERRTLETLALLDAQEAARRDHLTGLLNRRGLTERFDDLVKSRPDPIPLTVILIDIDHFKALNDSYGHAFGDQVLSTFANVVSRNVRVVDMVARWGGDEFIVVCADVDRRGVQRIAEKIRERIAGFDFGPCGQVTASFGIYWSNLPAADLGQLVIQADMALYAAKAGGRNCCRFTSSSLSKAA
ncbi:MAG: GGDEF domain-containing protein [Asticcacaulis sp.]|nr:GGDEF domain-containing protein [Asticcacaulis sp.]